MVLPLKPRRGGFLRPFGCGEFIRDFLMGWGPNDSLLINPAIGAPQSDIFYNYKTSLIKATALDRATKQEEKIARKENRLINPDNIEELTDKYIAQSPYKANGCRYHSFVVYFSTLQRLSWVEASGMMEPSSFQDNYSLGPPRIFYRLTTTGREASDSAWANPQRALYG